MGFIVDVLIKLTKSGSFTYNAHGGFGEIESNIAKLIASPADNGVLVVQVVNHEAFIQFSGGHTGIEIDFPIITAFQKSMEPALRVFFKSHGLEIHETHGSNGSLFLDVIAAPNAAQIAVIVRQLFVSVFGIDQNAKLNFRGERISAVA